MTTDFIPLAALVLSVAGIVISLLSYTRDRPVVRAWAEITWYRMGPNPDAETPRIVIRAANLGRRPVVLLRLALVGEGQRWFLHLKQPVLPQETTLDEAIELLDRHVLAQNSVVRLLEGEVFDVDFWPKDHDKFLFLHSEHAVTAQRLYIEDCAGRRYRVKNDAHCLEELFKAADL